MNNIYLSIYILHTAAPSQCDNFNLVNISIIFEKFK